MITSLKNSTSLFLLAVFLLPSIVRLEHHHESYDCKANTEQHFQSLHKKCAVCDFGFSVFSLAYEHFILQKDNPAFNYSNHYRSVNYSSLSTYSFLLRAPPFKQI
jgi:hypothetical protein